MLDYFIDWDSLWKIPFLYLSTRWLSASFSYPKRNTASHGKQRSQETRSLVDEEPEVAFLFPQIIKYYKILSITLNVIEIVVLLCSSAVSIRPFLASIWLLAEPAAGDDMYLSPTFVFGTLLTILGTISRRTAHSWYSARTPNQLVATGPYRVIRHPSYTGALLVVVGLLLCQIGEGSWWRASDIGDTMIGGLFVLVWLGMAVVVIGGLVYQTAKEDREIAATYKEEWVVWAKRTPYKLLPFVY